MKKEIPAAWGTAYDKFGDASAEFTASREGLVYLRSKIDEALAKGEATISSEANFDFEKIAVADRHPSQTLEPRPILDKIMKVLVLSVVALFIVFAVYGCRTMFADIRK
jgi:hypothetical protein